jgi:predicted DNA-binding transcriptional regulator AlpA
MDAGHRKRLRAIQAAGYLQVSRSTLAKWRMNGQGPCWHRCGPRIVFYLQDEIDAWLRECDQRQPAKARGSADS